MNWKAGDSLKELEKAQISRADLVRYADASGDHNPIHLDEEFAKKAGFPSVIVHGMLSMAFMGDHVRANFSESEFCLQRLRARFRKVTFPGDTLTCLGEVRRVDDNGTVHLSLKTRNQAGEITTEGEAQLRPVKS